VTLSECVQIERAAVDTNDAPAYPQCTSRRGIALSSTNRMLKATYLYGGCLSPACCRFCLLLSGGCI
jgi:hypothetical protein